MDTGKTVRKKKENGERERETKKDRKKKKHILRWLFCFGACRVDAKLLHTTTFPEAQTKIGQQWPGIIT